MRVLVVGCGYVGLPLGTFLRQQGHEIWGVRRPGSPVADLIAAEIKPIHADLASATDWEKVFQERYDWVVNTASSNKGGVEEYRTIYLDGTNRLLRAMAKNPPLKYLYTSSTSVYGQTDGSIVKESSATEPATETGKILVQTEQVLLEAWTSRKFPSIILRSAGIYGPDRGHLFQQYLKNEARLYENGFRLINMIHRDDLVGVIAAALRNGRPGEIYNAVDDEPVPQIHFFRWLSETLGKWMPPAANEGEAQKRKRAATHKKVSNRKIKMELGYQFRYPTFRQGYTAEITRLERAGLLDILPEAR